MIIRCVLLGEHVNRVLMQTTGNTLSTHSLKGK